MPYIQIKTDIPGPKAKKLLERKAKAVPNGPFHTIPSFAQKGNGALLEDVDGNVFIDFAGAIGTLNVGHTPVKVVEAVKSQLTQYIHPSFHVMMYEPYIRLAEKLNSITPGDYPKKTVFLNSGAEAVENAIKIARKYTGKKGIISFERAFHGRTFMAMSLTSKVKPYKNGFGPFLTDTYKLPYPYYFHDTHMDKDELDAHLLQQFEAFFIREAAAEDIAAVIMEPIQGEGGFVIPSKQFVQGVQKICEKYGILFIADEIQTGFGRTGFLFASEYFGIEPDMITMSKSLAAGIPISAVTGKSEIMDACAPGEIGGTYGGSPLGCVAALAVLETIETEDLLTRANAIGEFFQKTFSPLVSMIAELGEVRNIGAMCALEFVTDKGSKTPNAKFVKQVLERAHKRGLILMNAGLYSNVIRILCPLVISNEQLEEGFSVLKKCIEEVSAGIDEAGV
ncbi:4-aminobutyrate--2-oxoglutarate transaminase [Caldibacillus lycopersici]|uniref:(S)-3-amino-2-methylpropionate transaminase n=1 Tax=Perspicuibacillus lycopersici TaxID=1325689 RepID=A0AAE3ISY7_9BACI|nr:4-aminobutyrate--2-oxoglutarate transaminase [Perspicuibacillus lycopersici]MCU9613622.1 4-aminobutyrate--2-oxoglutarate transaminase [Perspicuibacillus lycopersici]